MGDLDRNLVHAFSDEGSLGCWAITLKTHGFLYHIHRFGYTDALCIKALLVSST